MVPTKFRTRGSRRCLVDTTRPRTRSRAKAATTRTASTAIPKTLADEVAEIITTMVNDQVGARHMRGEHEVRTMVMMMKTTVMHAVGAAILRPMHEDQKKREVADDATVLTVSGPARKSGTARIRRMLTMVIAECTQPSRSRLATLTSTSNNALSPATAIEVDDLDHRTSTLPPLG